MFRCLLSIATLATWIMAEKGRRTHREISKRMFVHLRIWFVLVLKRIMKRNLWAGHQSRTYKTIDPENGAHSVRKVEDWHVRNGARCSSRGSKRRSKHFSTPPAGIFRGCFSRSPFHARALLILRGFFTVKRNLATFVIKPPRFLQIPFVHSSSFSCSVQG